VTREEGFHQKGGGEAKGTRALFKKTKKKKAGWGTGLLSKRTSALEKRGQEKKPKGVSRREKKEGG